MFSKTRTTIAVLVAALSLAVAAGPASAARSMDYDPGTYGSYSFEPTSTVAAQEVAPTGNGPAGESECEAWQTEINQKQDWLDASLAEDADMGIHSHQSVQLHQDVEEAEDAALSDGCMIIY